MKSVRFYKFGTRSKTPAAAPIANENLIGVLPEKVLAAEGVPDSMARNSHTIIYLEGGLLFALDESVDTVSRALGWEA